MKSWTSYQSCAKAGRNWVWKIATAHSHKWYLGWSSCCGTVTAHWNSHTGRTAYCPAYWWHKQVWAQVRRYQIATEQDTYTLGIRETASGSAQTTLDTLQEILDYLTSAAAAKKGAGTETGKIILSKIKKYKKNTMSDRAATEKAFNDLLSHYRSEILPTVIHENRATLFSSAPIYEDMELKACHLLSFEVTGLTLYFLMVLKYTTCINTLSISCKNGWVHGRSSWKAFWMMQTMSSILQDVKH